VAKNKEVSFLVDSMLGRLAKWLRVMGYDTHYQKVYTTEDIEKLILTGRLFITKNESYHKAYESSFLIKSDKVKDQLHEIKNRGHLPLNPKRGFSRCLLCNMKLISVTAKDASGHIPEYILTQNIKGVSFCPDCHRYFWPGSHRKKMLDQITQWKLWD